ncbi:phenylalanine--tRNA ligase subunit alpha, partial [bacterium]|nr:phenylalanine--tRNA ligase subunit alpha [bacterium]
MQKELENLREKAKKEISQIREKKEDLELIRIKYLGRKGLVTKILRIMKQLSQEERKIIGKLANQIKEEINDFLNRKKEDLKQLIFNRDIKEDLDVTLPGRPLLQGKLHPLTRILEEIKIIFERLNFDIVEGPEVETEYYNFEALNTPADHPARDMQATFYVSDGVVLRTQTSPVQIRIMEKKSPPLRIIAPGRCYRSDAIDASHSPVFHQVEGLVVGKEVTFRHLKSIMKMFFKQIFGEDIEIRLTPSLIPFTEPSAEVSVRCVLCKGKG